MATYFRYSSLRRGDSMRNGFRAFVFFVLGGATFAPIIKEYIKSLFWDRVVQFMNPAISLTFLFVQDYGIPIAMVLAGLYFGMGKDKLAAIIDWGRRKLNIWLMGAALATILLFACIGGYLWIGVAARSFGHGVATHRSGSAAPDRTTASMHLALTATIVLQNQ